MAASRLLMLNMFRIVKDTFTAKILGCLGTKKTKKRNSNDDTGVGVSLKILSEVCEISSLC